MQGVSPQQSLYSISYISSNYLLLQVLLVSKESQFLLRIFNGSCQTLDIIKDRILHTFADLFSSKSNLDVITMRFNCSITYLCLFIYLFIFCQKSDNYWYFIMCRQGDVVQSVIREVQGSEDWSSKGNESNGEGYSTVGFNVLDAMLKHSLDRLKSMRFV